MPTEFCEHLTEYETQFNRTADCYQRCMELLDRILSGAVDAELPGAVADALQDWARQDAALRELLVAEVRAGRIRLPVALLRHRSRNLAVKHHATHHRGHPICAICRFVVPRLDYPEWQIAHNGTASFRGRELPVTANAG